MDIRLYASLPIPDARASDPETYRDECAALVRIIRANCRGPDGQDPGIERIAELIGVGRTTLADWVSERGDLSRRRANPGFAGVYALRALVSSLFATRDALWGPPEPAAVTVDTRPPVRR